jgi:hypothetical protein
MPNCDYLPFADEILLGQRCPPAPMQDIIPACGIIQKRFMRFDSAFKPLVALGFLLPYMIAGAGEWQPRRLLAFTGDSCQAWEATAAPAAGYAEAKASQSDITFRGTQIGTRFHLQVDEAYRVELDVINRSGRPTRFVGSLYNSFGDPLVLVALDSDCEQQVARQIRYSENGQAISIVSLDAALAPRGEPDWLNPPLLFVERADDKALKHPGDATPLRVGMVDSGVNYRLPEINRRLARDENDRLIGFDRRCCCAKRPVSSWCPIAIPGPTCRACRRWSNTRPATRSVSSACRSAATGRKTGPPSRAPPVLIPTCCSSFRPVTTGVTSMSARFTRPRSISITSWW